MRHLNFRSPKTGDQHWFQADDGALPPRQQLKHLLQNFIARLRPWRWLDQHKLLVLMYHRVLPANHHDMPWVQPGMYVTPETLKRHISWLRQEFKIVDLHKWLERGHTERRDNRPVCAITFDDGWLDNYDFAWPILRQEQVPATMFVTSALVGGEQSYWPERLTRLVWYRLSARSLQQLETDPFHWIYALSPSVFRENKQRTRTGIDQLIVAAKRYPDQEIEARLSAAEAALTTAGSGLASFRDLANWDELKEMTDTGLIRLGSHTRHHTRLKPGLPETLLEDEIAGSAREIRHHTGQLPSLFCYPNGDFSAAAEHIVSRHYAAAVTTMRGWSSLKLNRYRLKRIGLHEDISNNKNAFLSKLSGWY